MKMATAAADGWEGEGGGREGGGRGGWVRGGGWGKGTGGGCAECEFSALIPCKRKRRRDNKRAHRHTNGGARQRQQHNADSLAAARRSQASSPKSHTVMGSGLGLLTFEVSDCEYVLCGSDMCARGCCLQSAACFVD